MNILKNKKIDLSNTVISKERTLLMGISIIVIIFFHYVDDCRVYNVNYNEFFKWWIEWFASSSVDMFAFMSGFGLYYSLKKNYNVSNFYRKRLVKIIIPYLIVAVPAFIWRDMYVSGYDFTYVIKELTFYTLFKWSRTWFWYIGFSILVYAIFPYIFKLVDADCGNDEDSKRAMDDIKLIAIFGAITACLVVISSSNAAIFKNANILFLRIPFFIFGAFVGKSSYNRRNSFAKWIFLFVFSVFIRYMDCKVSMHSIIVRRYSMALLNICVCVFIAYIFACFKAKYIRWGIEWCGKHSLELYLLHVTIRSVLNIYGRYTYEIKNELIVILGSIIGSFILQHITNLISKIFIKDKRKVEAN